MGIHKPIHWTCRIEEKGIIRKMFAYPFTSDYAEFIGEEVCKKRLKQFLLGKYYSYKVKHIFNKVILVSIDRGYGEEVIVDKREKSS